MFDLMTRRDRDLFGALPELVHQVLTFTEPGHTPATGSSFLPPVDVIETEQEFRLRAECPGLDKESLGVTMEGGVLTISGEKKDEWQEKEVSYTRAERRYGRFSRCFTIPSKVATDQIEAHYSDGVLEIVLPKAKEAQPQRIPVKIK